MARARSMRMAKGQSGTVNATPGTCPNPLEQAGPDRKKPVS